jgi:hypothetical protein
MDWASIDLIAIMHNAKVKYIIFIYSLVSNTQRFECTHAAKIASNYLAIPIPINNITLALLVG